ncbi:MAG: Smr/MutS family protein [Bacteroidales bacterium]|nr:Smr/MutS family protein [Bacteroidales bacterium]MBR0053408.1 Smr/MutS family protein [Bacteroidales bacterium]
MKLSSLKDLKVIKKDLAPEPEGKPALNQPRSKTVILRSKEEEKARREGLARGQKVRMMDSNDTATIVGFGKDCYELELDGLVIRAIRSEFIPVDLEEDRKLRSSIQPLRSKDAEEPLASEDPLADLTVDLHIECIPGSDGIPEWAALEYQMNYFRQVLRKNLKHRGKRIIFIHGVGDGVLASAIRNELDEVFAVSCTYTFGPMGATNVTIR